MSTDRPLSENGQPLPEAALKSVVIPIRIVDGHVTADSGQPLLALLNCTGTLRVPAWAVRNPGDLELLSGISAIPLLPRQTRLYCRLGARQVPPNLRAECVELPLPKPSSYNALFAEIILECNLRLIYRGTKPAILDDAKCSIPKMPDAQPKSLNEAYKLISGRYEPGRRSAGGNVFSNIYLLDSDGKSTIELGDVRTETVALWNALKRSFFKATVDGKEVEIRAGHGSAMLDSVLRGHGQSCWAFISVSNPGSNVLPDDVNRQRLEKLSVAVDGTGCRFYEGRDGSAAGRSAGEGVLAIGLPSEDARALGRQFNQLAVVVGELGKDARLVSC